MDTMKGSARLRMVADKDTEKGGFIAEQAPFCSLQTAESKKTAFCCASCASYLGNLDAQLLRAQGKLQKASDFVS